LLDNFIFGTGESQLKNKRMIKVNALILFPFKIFIAINN